MLSSGLRKVTYLYAAVRPATDDAFALVLASPRASRRTPTPSCCSIKPDGAARRRSRCRWEEPSTASKAYVFLFLMSCLEPKEVVEESRFSSYMAFRGKGMP